MESSGQQQLETGCWRRFGQLGPVYEVLGKEGDLPDGDAMMRVRVLETGEELAYQLTKINDDPLEG